VVDPERQQERDVQDRRGRRGQAIVAAAVAALLLVGATGCGGSSSDGASGSDGSTKTTQGDSGSDKGSDSGSDSGSDQGSGDLPNPCDLVPIEKASEILGGESAEPEAASSDIGVGTKSCSWQTQEGKDNPTLDGAGHILTLNVFSPPETMSMDDFWKAAKAGSDESVDLDGCDEAFYASGILSALKDGVYLSGTAGLASTSPEAKSSAEDLVSAACSNV
jgi:hypothetical protein